MGEYAQFLGMILWTDETTLKLNGTVNLHKSVF